MCEEGISLTDILFSMIRRKFDIPIKFSSSISKFLTIAGKNKKFVIFRKIHEEILKIIFGGQIMGSRSDGSDLVGSDVDFLLINDIFMVEMQKELKDCKSHENCLLAVISHESPGYTMVFSFTDQCYLSSRLHFRKNDDSLYQRYTKGPSIRRSTTNGKILGDQVSALRCLNWPSGTRERWLQRPRSGWPPKHVVEDLSETSCVVVPIGKENSELSDFEWRFAFPFVERGLVWSFNTVQLQCFVLLKMLNNTILKKIDKVDDGINSFHIKMVMFWECENSDPKDWSEGNLLDCVRRCLHRLLLAIQKKELKHFIIEERNVIDTKLKKSETRENVIEILKTIESNISDSIIYCISKDMELCSLLGMIYRQGISIKSQILKLYYNRMICNRLAWMDKINLVTIIGCTMGVLCERSETELIEIFQNIRSKIDILLSEMKKKSYTDSIGIETMSSFMKDIYLISNGKTSHKEIEKILEEVTRSCIAFINIQIGSRLFTKAAKFPEDRKKDMLLDAERHFKKGVDMDNMTGQLYLATYYLASDKHKSAEQILDSMVRQNGVLVCTHNTSVCDSILINDGNLKLTFGIFHGFIHIGYALYISFTQYDLEIVPDVLKYELCMQRQGVDMHPLVYARYLQICFGIKHKPQRSVKLTQELRRSLILNESNAWKFFRNFNILAYCYRQIGLSYEAIYFYIASMLCFPNNDNSALFHLAFLLKEVSNTKTKPVKH